MMFSVIYSYRCSTDEYEIEKEGLNPPIELQAEAMEMTEHDYECEDGEKQAKWGGLLTKQEFGQLVRHIGFNSQSDETMGMLGAPGGSPFEVTPAFAFQSEYGFMFVCPMPRIKLKTGRCMTWENFQRARKATESFIANAYH